MNRGSVAVPRRGAATNRFMVLVRIELLNVNAPYERIGA